ncbi:MAG: DUF2800 domain-containing protein [Clostridiales bacterium]|nr:DUF2800 domain-containing protein [Clostridiales bacterium]
MPTLHAKCSASASHRWINCTAAPTYEMQFPQGETSIYAREGTLAHQFAELAAQYNFNLVTKRTRTTRIKKLQAEELYNEEMLKTSEFYAEYLYQKSMTFPSKPHVATEVRVDFSEYVPEGFGTCDCIMIGGNTLHITDYKHGKGVPVSAENNSQMRLYALGALNQYAMIYGETIEKVSMAIVQPRITEDVSEEALTVEELLAWGEWLKPIAREAQSGPGTFKPGEWCRFCNGRAVCAARAQYYMELEAYENSVPEGSLTPEQLFEMDKVAILRGEKPTTLTDAEVGDLLIRGKELAKWLGDLQDYALNAILDGKVIPGWKLVEGRSDRKFTDMDAVIERFKVAGYEEAMLYERKPKTLTALEKLMGKKDFAEKIGSPGQPDSLVMKAPGKPTLVEVSDKREAYNSAAADAAGLT